LAEPAFNGGHRAGCHLLTAGLRGSPAASLLPAPFAALRDRPTVVIAAAVGCMPL